MRAILVGDVHLSDRPPSIRTETYALDILKKLDFVVQKAIEESVDAIIFAGDVFHIKTPTRTSHKLVIATHQVLTQYHDIPVLIVPGNHDMQHDRLESLDGQPLGALCRMDGVEMLVGWHQTLPVYGLPFLYDYTKELKPWMEEWASHNLPALMVTHAPLVQPGRTLPYEFIDAEDWSKMMGGGSCYFGHMHDWDGAFEVGASWFCNQGAISRGSLHESSLKRKPAVTLYDDSNAFVNPFTRIEVPHRPVEEVFRLTLKEAQDEKVQHLDDFLDSVGKTSLESLSVEAVLEHAKSLGLASRTLKQIEECIDVAMG